MTKLLKRVLGSSGERGEEGVSYRHLCQELHEDWEEGEEPNGQNGMKGGVPYMSQGTCVPFQTRSHFSPSTGMCVRTSTQIYPSTNRRTKGIKGKGCSSRPGTLASRPGRDRS